ncbi:MAG: DEAD/DEAH box helicase, partial [Acetatifactor sp.]|nr:DEAD/DEAH box helicase [Acetatifactor sp.]
DTLLAGGEYFWHMEEDGRLRFDPVEGIDWDQEAQLPWEELSDRERRVAEALSRRGASFMQALSHVLDGESPYDTLLSLMEKGLVCADSFVPVRQWLNREKIQKAAARQRVGARVKALQAGRFELVKPLRPLTIPEQMERCFDRYLVLCRETAAAWGLPWQEALKLLRVWEYTGQVRRGYFVKGLSGAQFIRRQDFESVTARLMHPQAELVWLNAADPMQPWGKLLAHEPERNFVNVPGTAVAFRDGLPAAVFERQGKVLRCFDTGEGQEDGLREILRLFEEEFQRGRIFPSKKRIVVKEYPAQAADALAESGFLHEIQDYVLYR